MVTQVAPGRSPPPLPGASPSGACLPHLRKPCKVVSAHHPPPDPKARVTLRQQLSCGAPQRQKDKASSQCRSRAGTSATCSRQRPALPGSPSLPRQAPGYRRWHHRLSPSRWAEGYSILRAVFPPSSCEVSGMLPGGRLLPEPSPEQPQSPALSFDSALLPTACDGALAPSPTALCQEMVPSFE